MCCHVERTIVDIPPCPGILTQCQPVLTLTLDCITLGTWQGCQFSDHWYDWVEFESQSCPYTADILIMGQLGQWMHEQLQALILCGLSGVALTSEKLRIANAQHVKKCVSSPAAKATISTDLPKIDKHENTNI